MIPYCFLWPTLFLTRITLAAFYSLEVSYQVQPHSRGKFFYKDSTTRRKGATVITFEAASARFLRLVLQSPDCFLGEGRVGYEN